MPQSADVAPTRVVDGQLAAGGLMRRMLVSILKGLNFLVRKFSAFTHYAQFAVQWYPKPRPEWFDHYLDQHWQWSATNNSLWVERGVFSRLVMKPNSKMLEICCGDGFNARHFIPPRHLQLSRLILTRTRYRTRRDTIPRRMSHMSCKTFAKGCPRVHLTTSFGTQRSSILLKPKFPRSWANWSNVSGLTVS